MINDYFGDHGLSAILNIVRNEFFMKQGCTFDGCATDVLHIRDMSVNLTNCKLTTFDSDLLAKEKGICFTGKQQLLCIYEI